MIKEPHPNPRGRKYSYEEWLAARHAWPQYKGPRERPSPAFPEGRGPLIYGNGHQLVSHVGELLNECERRIKDLRLLLLAVQREADNPPVDP